jgi:heat shock protein HslJ
MGPASSTQILCEEPEGIMQQENTYLTKINNAAIYELSAGQLVIKNSNGHTLFTYAGG